MYNSSKALLIAAGVIIGVLILSVGVVLFAMFGNSSKDIINKLEEAKVTEYNNNFYKYYGEGVIITAHDIVTITNFARKANKEGQVENVSGYSQSTDYVQINVKNKKETEIVNFEKKENSDANKNYYDTFIKNNTFKKDNSGNETTQIKYYKCTDIITNVKTRKVIYIRIEEI